MQFRSKTFPVDDSIATSLVTSGPLYTMSLSSSVRSLNGTSTRTPRDSATLYIQLMPNMFQDSTAPWPRVLSQSGTSLETSTSLTMPVPEHLGQAPSLLNASDSALGPSKEAPHSGQTSAFPAATSVDGGRRCPFGQRWLPSLENIRRRWFSSSDIVPNVLLTPGTAGLW